MAPESLLFYLLLGMLKLKIFLLSCLYCFAGYSQTLKGKVLNTTNQKPIPFANVVWMESGIANITNQNGSFIIQIPTENDSLLINSIGFKDKILSKKEALALQTFLIKPETIEVQEVNIVAKKKLKKRKRKTNPAYILHKKIIRERSKNDQKRQSTYECNVYNKIEIDINNIDSVTKDAILFKPVSFVFEKVDTSTLPKPFAPIFLSEAYSNYYYRRYPKQEKDIIHASQNTGLKIPSLAQFTGNTYTDFNIYNEYINLFQKSFVSPLADKAWISYNFYLTDSIKKNDSTFYRLEFYPKRKHDLTFKGFMIVDNKSFGVNKIHLEMTKNANVNFIKWLVIDQEYSFNNTVWQLDFEKTFMDINPFDKTYGFYVKKSTSWLNYKFNSPQPNSFYTNADLIQVADSAYEKGSELLDSLRPIPLSLSESNTYHTIDSAMETGYMKVMKNLSQMVYTGYYPFKYWEYGPYYTTYSWNTIEGQRIRVGFQTTQNVFKKTHLLGHYAYGTGDQTSKYKAQITHFYGMKKQWRFIRYTHLNDYKILSSSDNAFQEDNIFAALTRRTDPKFTHTKRDQLTWLHEWYNGINNSLTLKREEFKPIGTLDYYTPNGTAIDKINLNSFTIAGRLAYQEKFINYGFRRLSLNTRKPAFDYFYSRGFAYKGEGYNYHKAEIRMSDRYYLGFTGFSEVVLSASKVWGSLPYPLLLNHQGNDSYYFDNRAFNLMNPFEFVSDQQVSALVRHNFNGMIFNGVPFLRKLHLRSFIFANGVYGTLNNSHEALVILPDGLSDLQEPYLEAGFGIENIFHAVRLDFIWRLTNNNSPDVQQFGVTFDIVPSF